MFGLLRRKDPICGMKETKGTGMERHGKWFCSNDCVKKFEEQKKDGAKHGVAHGNRSCCH